MREAVESAFACSVRPGRLLAGLRQFRHVRDYEHRGETFKAEGAERGP